MIKQWHQLVQDRDIIGLDKILAENVVLHSPVLHHPLEGKTIVFHYLEAAFHTFINDSFQYVREFSSERACVLEFTVEIEGIFVNGVDMIQFNSERKIDDFKVMIRPLKAINLIHKKMASMLEALDA